MAIVEAEGASSVSEQAKVNDGSWLRLALFALFVVVVSGVYAFVMRAAYQPDQKPAFGALFADNFDRPRNEASLGSASGDRKWTAADGLWGIDAGKAVVTFPGKETSIAVVGDVPSASVSVTLTGKARCGLVARYVDASNYVALERVPAFAVWNVVVVRDGVATVLDKIPDDGGSPAQLRLEVGARVVTAGVGERSVTVTDTAAPVVSSAAVGLIGHDAAVTGCTWDDLWVFKGN